jgi:hypothetical protein
LTTGGNGTAGESEVDMDEMDDTRASADAGGGDAETGVVAPPTEAARCPAVS